ncbi:unnamed protein product, partial [Symbiodinium sp. CCMP2592]
MPKQRAMKVGGQASALITSETLQRIDGPWSTAPDETCVYGLEQELASRELSEKTCQVSILLRRFLVEHRHAVPGTLLGPPVQREMLRAPESEPCADRSSFQKEGMPRVLAQTGDLAKPQN